MSIYFRLLSEISDELAPVEMKNPDIILLTGVGRSGTTLLQGMLNMHSRIYFPPETHFFKRYILPYIVKRKLPDPEKLASDKFLARLDHRIFDHIVNQSYLGLNDLKEAFLFILNHSDSEFVGDKDTEYIRYIPHLKQIFPNAFLVHIIRDPRDVVNSRIRTDWGKKRSIAFHSAEYNFYVKQILKYGPELFGSKYVELRYEDLIRQPEKELKKILNRFNLEFEESMLEFHKSTSSIIAQDELNWKQNLSKPLIINNAGRWMGNLELHEVSVIESGLSNFMKAYGYKPIGNSIGLNKRFYKFCISSMLWLKSQMEKVN